MADEVMRVSGATGAVEESPADAPVTTGTDAKTGLRTVSPVMKAADADPESPRSSEDSFEVVADPATDGKDGAQVQVIRTEEEITKEREEEEIAEAMKKFEDMERREKELKAKTELTDKNFPVLTDGQGWQVAPAAMLKEATAEDLQMSDGDEDGENGSPDSPNKETSLSWKDKAQKAKDLPHPPKPRGDAAYRKAADQARSPPKQSQDETEDAYGGASKDSALTTGSDGYAVASAEGRSEAEIAKAVAGKKFSQKFGMSKSNPRGKAYNPFKDDKRIIAQGVEGEGDLYAGEASGDVRYGFDGVEVEAGYEAVYDGLELNNYCTKLGDGYGGASP